MPGNEEDISKNPKDVLQNTQGISENEEKG
jgi:hypothetical protein